MGIRASIQIDGAMQFAQNMQRLDSDLRRIGYEEILYAWGQIALREVMARVPEGETGLLRDSMQAYPPQIWSAGDGGAIHVGSDGEDYQGDTFYAAMVEYGHGIGKRTSRSRRKRWADEARRAEMGGRLRVDPHPYMRPAMDATAPQLMPAAAEILQGLYKTMGRAA